MSGTIGMIQCTSSRNWPQSKGRSWRKHGPLTSLEANIRYTWGLRKYGWSAGCHGRDVASLRGWNVRTRVYFFYLEVVVWQGAVVAPSRGYNRSGTSFVITFSSAMTRPLFSLPTSHTPSLLPPWTLYPLKQLQSDQQGRQNRYVSVRWAVRERSRSNVSFSRSWNRMTYTDMSLQHPAKCQITASASPSGASQPDLCASPYTAYYWDLLVSPALGVEVSWGLSARLRSSTAQPALCLSTDPRWDCHSSLQA